MFSDKLIKKLLIEVVTRRQEFSSIQPIDVQAAEVPDPGYWGEYQFSFIDRKTEQATELTIIIEETETTFEVHIVPQYEMVLKVRSPLLGLQQEMDGGDYLGDSNYEDINRAMHEDSPWTISIEKTDHFMSEYTHQQVVIDAVLELKKKHGIEQAEWLLKYWYMRESFLPAFNDQTTKHKAKQLMAGLPELTESEVIDFICDLTDEEGGWDLREVILQIEGENDD